MSPIGGGISQSLSNARRTTMQLKATRNFTITAFATLIALTQFYFVTAVAVGNGTPTLVVQQLKSN
jgi:hypothetical protein